MKAFAGFISTTLLLTSLSTLAHEGHDHMPVTMKKAVEIALVTAADYTVKAPAFSAHVLDKSWAKLSQATARIHENKHGYYVVALANPQQHETLYMRILLDGTVDDANLSGNFKSASASSAADKNQSTRSENL